MGVVSVEFSTAGWAGDAAWTDGAGMAGCSGWACGTAWAWGSG